MTGVIIYTDEDITGLGDGYLAPGLSQGEIYHGFRY